MSINLLEILKPQAHVVVVGLGASGLSAVRFLLSLGVRISVSEGGRLEDLAGDKVSWLQEKGVFLETGGHSSELLASADCLLVSPGVPPALPALQAAAGRGIPLLGELALAPDFLKTPVIAVSGTNGKSTVTTLIGELLRSAGKKVFVGGNIGVPLTEYLAGEQDCDVAVLDVSSYQLDGAGAFRPGIGVLLNITPDHLDRYATYEEYVASKLSLFRNQQPGDVAVLNADDGHIAAWLAELGSGRAPWALAGSVLCFAAKERPGLQAFLTGATVVLPAVQADEAAEEYDLTGTELAQAPNTENAMAAILAARAMGCEPDAIRAGLSRFLPLAHRLALVAEINGVVYYDDSKATNVGAVWSALAGMERPVVLIAGGRDKGGSYEMLVEPVKSRVKAMVLIGEAQGKMAEFFAPLTRIVRAADMAEAVRQAAALSRPGDAVLLSPACASFDMFRSYGHRGEVFCRAVRALALAEETRP
jgi:UDP-N-acetylmuramoylalanine--D-glutamate ligase